jgi:hypothetical protein
LTCKTNLFLYNNKCLDKCPNGTFALKKEVNGIEYYFTCAKCYENCNSCKEKGDHTDMKCLTCRDKYIKYKDNCYKILDTNSLRFYVPEENSVSTISNCFDKFGLYIKENTYECIPLPDEKEGYFVSNKEAGILSKCHGNCLTCEKGEKEEDGILISMECLECKDSNIQVEKNCFPIMEYGEKKIVFDIAEIEPGIGIGSCLNFGLSIFNGEYKCITKPENTYYVLNGSMNTGVIKYCHEACKTCDSGSLTDNTNCIECAPGYVKTEYSNTNCLLETSLPSNYYKNNIDNIYYECYPNCKKCDANFDIFNNDMHCLECLSDYFFVYGENNCYKKEEILPNKKHYFSNSDNKFHKCYYTCSECSNNEPSEEIHYCEKCAKAYYFLSETTNCYDINYTENGYYLSNITIMNVTEPKFQKCYQRCKTCFGGLESNSETKEENHNCKECAENYYKLDNGSYPNNCYDNETINAWKKIELSTINTWKNSEIEEIEVTERNSESEVSSYPKEIKETNNYNFEKKYSTESLNYKETENSEYIDYSIKIEKTSNTENYKEITNIELKINTIEIESTIEIKKSTYIENNYETINSIGLKKTDFTETIDTFVKGDSTEIEKTSDTFVKGDSAEIAKTSYTFVKRDSTGIPKTSKRDNLIECDQACLTCFKAYENNNTNCIQCNTDNGYYPIFGKDNSNCFNNETIKSGYYLNTKDFPIKWNKCYDKCETCNSGGNAANMNCLSCKTDLINEFTNQKIIFKKTNNGNCIETCQNNTYMTSTGYCVTSCPNNTYKFSLNYSCINSCPKGYIINESKNECILKNIEKVSSTEEFKTLILSNISNFVNSSKVINGSNFIAVVLSSDNMKPEEQIKMGISAVDLGNCTEVLKEHYNIPKEENLIILNMETKKEENTKNETSNDDKSFNLGKNIHLEVYDVSGR